MRIVNKIEAKTPQMPRRKRVAAYARVSMESERLQHSLSAQVSFYSSLIQSNPAWEYVGVYADNGITGTKAEAREEFNRMIADCEAGKIDIVLTKSISRFARNTVDLLNTVRRLKELSVSVQFEKERIDSLTEDGELMLTLLASFAQEEIRSLSDNVKWGTRKRFEKGIPNGRFQIYGYRWEDDHLVIHEEEAKIVRLIYDNYLNGLSAETTEKQLAEMGVKSYKGQHFGNLDFLILSEAVLSHHFFYGLMTHSDIQIYHCFFDFLFYDVAFSIICFNYDRFCLFLGFIRNLIHFPKDILQKLFLFVGHRCHLLRIIRVVGGLYSVDGKDLRPDCTGA